MKGVFYAVIDGEGDVVSFENEKFGTTKAVFDCKNEATKLANKYRNEGFQVRTVGFMHVVKKP